MLTKLHWLTMMSCSVFCFSTAAQKSDFAAEKPADSWRKQSFIVDAHVHVTTDPSTISLAAAVMRRNGIGLGINLTGGTVTKAPGSISELEKAIALTNKVAPGQFVHCMNLDYSN